MSCPYKIETLRIDEEKFSKILAPLAQEEDSIHYEHEDGKLVIICEIECETTIYRPAQLPDIDMGDYRRKARVKEILAYWDGDPINVVCSLWVLEKMISRRLNGF